MALISPPWYTVPPRGYGGTELVVYLLARELQAMGHDVRVYCAAGSSSEFPTVQFETAAWQEELGSVGGAIRELTYLSRVYRDLEHRGYLIHEHCGTGYALAAQAGSHSAAVATIHGDIDARLGEFLSQVDDRVGLVGISRAQQTRSNGLDWLGAVHNAFDERLLRFQPRSGEYLVQLARISPQKGQHVAIEIARRAGVPLILAGKIGEDGGGAEYFAREVEPHLGAGVTWIADVTREEKSDLLGHARAMLFPIQWEEPFGVAMIEAMACGTPVIATPRGAVPEIVDEGVTGWIGADAEAMLDCLSRVGEIDRKICASTAHARFGARRMALEYVTLYRAWLKRRHGGTGFD